MASKTFFVIFASALLVQGISAQCNNANIGYGLNGYGGFGSGAGIGLGSTGQGVSGLGCHASGGGLIVSSVSPIAPTGLHVISDNVINGPVTVSGVLPFLTAIEVVGELPSGGLAETQYGCGNGNIGIISENVAPAGNPAIGAGLGLGYGAGAGLNAGYGLAAPLAGAVVSSPCGCGRGIY